MGDHDTGLEYGSALRSVDDHLRGTFTLDEDEVGGVADAQCARGQSEDVGASLDGDE